MLKPRKNRILHSIVRIFLIFIPECENEGTLNDRSEKPHIFLCWPNSSLELCPPSGASELLLKVHFVCMLVKVPRAKGTPSRRNNDIEQINGYRAA